MSLGVRKLRLLLLVEGRASSRACPERSRRVQAEQRSASFLHPLHTGHPERSRIMREAHDPAESKDPYQKWVLPTPRFRHCGTVCPATVIGAPPNSCTMFECFA